MSLLRMQIPPSGAVIEIPEFAGMTLFRVDSDLEKISFPLD